MMLRLWRKLREKEIAQLQQDLDRIHKWIQKWEMQFNAKLWIWEKHEENKLLIRVGQAKEEKGLGVLMQVDLSLRNLT